MVVTIDLAALPGVSRARSTVRIRLDRLLQATLTRVSRRHVWLRTVLLQDELGYDVQFGYDLVCISRIDSTNIQQASRSRQSKPFCRKADKAVVPVLESVHLRRLPKLHLAGRLRLRQQPQHDQSGRRSLSRSHGKLHDAVRCPARLRRLFVQLRRIRKYQSASRGLFPKVWFADYWP